MTATERFDKIRKEVDYIRQNLQGLIQQLEDFTSYEVDEVNERSDGDFETLMENITTATVQLEDWGDKDYNYTLLEKEFNKEIGDYLVLGVYEFDDEGVWTSYDKLDEHYVGFNDEVYIILKREGGIKVEAFGEKRTFKKGEYDKVRKYLDRVYLKNGYDGKYNV